MATSTSEKELHAEYSRLAVTVQNNGTGWNEFERRCYNLATRNETVFIDHLPRRKSCRHDPR